VQFCTFVLRLLDRIELRLILRWQLNMGVMDAVFERVLGEVESGLAATKKEKNLVLRYGRCKRLLESATGELRQSLPDHPFPSPDEEIRYFKMRAPLVYSALFYYMKLLFLETTRQYLAGEKWRAILEKEWALTEDFFVRHAEILSYADQGGPCWDTCLYTRHGQGHWLPGESGVFIGDDLTTGCYWTARARANEDLRVWLQQELTALDQAENGARVEQGAKDGLTWTSNVVDLVELAYAMHAMGCFNKGKATLKDVVQWLGKQLGVETGNYHITFQELGQRKKSRTKFLDQLRERLEERLDGML
jgi:hypothetical protein